MGRLVGRMSSRGGGVAPADRGMSRPRLYLAALYLKEGGSPERAAVSFGGDDRLVSDYVESEFLARVSHRQRTFLTRTAVLEYSIAAGDVDAIASLVRKIAVPTHRQGRDTTVQRWFGWLDDRGAIDGHPMVAVLASLLSMVTARPADAERWAAWSIAGSTGTRRGPTTLPPRRGPPCCGLPVPPPRRCGPTPTRPCAGSRRSVSSPGTCAPARARAGPFRRPRWRRRVLRGTPVSVAEENRRARRSRRRAVRTIAGGDGP